MFSYVARRLAFAVALVWGVSSAALILTRLAPGDFATGSIGIGGSRQQIADARARYGLDRPILDQYGRWLAGALRLDFGRSLAYDRPVSDLLPERARNTALLALAALTAATLIGLPLGVFTGTRAGGLVPAAIRAVSVLLLSTPPLVTSLFFVFVAARTGWLPIGGLGTGSHLVIPAAALALPIAAMFERVQSQAMREVMSERYIVAAVARGVPRARLLWRDGLKAALRPAASVYGLVAASLLSGSFAVEMVTSWPGLGRLMLDALRARDVFLVAGCAATGAVFLACGTLLSDVALAVVDPRVRDAS
jgi:peptide/nickel transport system permease protein